MTAGPEAALTARLLDALLREDYAGLRRFISGRTLALPGLKPIGLRPGFLSAHTVEQGPPLDDVLAAVRRVADPRDDVAAFERECREALATERLHQEARPGVMRALSHLSDLGPGTYYDTLAAFSDHPVHPMGRCKLGLSESDLRQYAPEFAPTFPLRWAVVPREKVTAHGQLPAWWPVARDESTVLFPVHPLTAPLVDVPLVPGSFLQVAPTLSMRTVAAGPLTHLKLPLPTSTLGLRNRRTIKPGTLADGAEAERALRRVLAEEPGLPVLLADEQTWGHAGDEHLGYLVRRFPPETGRAHVVPVAALLAERPEGGPVIGRWDVPALFGRYLDALLAWNVALFRRGIALEAHQQNVALVLRDDGDPKLLIKDNDGMLAVPGVAAFGDRRMNTMDQEALARVFVTITLHLCAAAPAHGLAERGLLPLRTGLAMIRDRLDALLGPEDAFLRARTLDADRLPTKAMVTAGTLVDKARTGAADINKHYGPLGPNYLRDEPCS